MLSELLSSNTAQVRTLHLHPIVVEIKEQDTLCVLTLLFRFILLPLNLRNDT